MPSLPELGATLNVPIAEVIRMGEVQAVNPESAVYKSMELALIEKMAAMKAATAEDVRKKGGKPRVYIAHAVPTNYRFSLVSAFPKFDIHFSSTDVRSGAVSLAMTTLIMEYMLSKFKVNRGKVLAYGCSLKQIVLRNRRWMHLCVPGHLVRAQSDFIRDDRAIAAITHSMNRGGRTGLLNQDYMTGTANVHCTSPVDCLEEAPAGVMVLNKTDTNFRQLAMFMRQHKMSLMFFAIPGSKEMELCTEGPLPELDAHVFPSEGGEFINICYKNAPAEDMSYRYANYLELVARTTVVIDGRTYHKEFDNRVHGYLVYKITCINHVFDEPPPPYKSWIESKYMDKYMVYVPVLKEGGCANDPTHWSLVGHPVDRAIVDDVADFAIRAQGVQEMSQYIERRLFTRTSNYSLVNQVVTDVSAIPIHLFDPLALAIYCGIFMKKYEKGKAVTTLAPHARQFARIVSGSSAGVTMAFTAMLFGNLVRSSSIVTDKIRSVYYDAVGVQDLPMPSFAVCPGFVEYSDSGSSNPRFTGWLSMEHTMTEGFTTALPGVMRSALLDGLRAVSVMSTTTTVDPRLMDAMLATGEAYVAEDATLQSAEHRSVFDIACGVYSSFAGILGSQPDVEQLVNEPGFQQTPMVVPDARADVARNHAGLSTVVPQKRTAITDTPTVRELTQKITQDHGSLPSVRMEGYTQNTLAFVPEIPPIVQGYVADNPKEYVRSGIMKIFPNSLVMTTSQFETDRTYSGWDVLAKGIRARLDVSKISGVKPESYYRPLLSGHVQPSVKDSFSTTWHSTNKRNFNTPADSDPVDVEFLWMQAKSAMFKVFYVPGAEQHLAGLPAIGPDTQSVAEWVTKLDERRRNKLAAVDGFTFMDMVAGAQDTQLMVKKKLKPTLDASYSTAVKYPQTIQYDPTGKTVAVFSPIISQKVQREQEILKPNVLVMQRKSVADVNKFLNGFDWRPNKLGERRYIEIDYSQYDKSQGKRLADMYARRMEMFGVLKDYVAFVTTVQQVRTVAAMKAGIKAWLRDQNQSGAAFTLDRNNDINEIVIAELLLRILDVIEFIMLMGDDIIIAVRGDVDVAHWEADLYRKYNLTLKAATHEHGYFCSMDIVHLPNGHTRVVADVVKRSLAFMDQSITEEDKFRERYVSYVDNMTGIQDLHVQHYLAAALPKRMRTYLPDTGSDAIMSLCKAHARFLTDYEAWRGMHADEKTLRTY